jgi:predicted membrane protein
MGLLIALNIKGRAFVIGATICALLVLMNVLMMRWNVVIGGQEIAKTGKGLLTYHLPLWGHEGLLAAILVTLAPFALLVLLTRLFPPWADPPGRT